MKHETSQRKILDLLKKEGPQTSSVLSNKLGITSMGARRHLERLTAEGLIKTQDIKSGVGRPKRLWSLTVNADKYFPDSHSQLTVDMLISIKTVFGDEGLNQLIEDRSQTAASKYQSVLAKEKALESKVVALVNIRSEEGYMANYYTVDNGFVFVENHCPVCTAATHCQGFCRSELEVFRQLFFSLADVQRTEHILQGARRCAYLISIV